MSIAQSLLPEWDHEVENTKKMLAAVPDIDMDWKPHDKSMSLGKLAAHVAEIPLWMSSTLEQPELNWADFNYKPPEWTSTAVNQADFAERANAAREILARTTDATMFENWTMRNGDRVYFTMPKIAVLRNFVMNHIVHHRAQLGVYLRLNGCKIPGMYGPSADETM